MLTKNDFSSEDWKTLRETPQLVGLATLLAGDSGIATVKESLALAQGFLEGQSNNVPLIRDLTNRTEMQDSQASLRDALGDLNAQISKDKLKGLAMERVAAALSVLEARGSADEVSAYRQFLQGLAEKVAKAAKEGGFLGFGGTRVSADEEAFLNELRTALQTRVRTA